MKKNSLFLSNIWNVLQKSFYRQLLVLFFIFFTFSSYATIYYVSSSGSDSNSGTSASTPWKSLTKVNGFTPRPGDQILFKRGDSWNGSITVKASGTSGSPITYGAYGTGEKPKIYGSEVISGWTLHSGKIYKASFSKNINQLFLNNSRMKAARYPNTGYFDITSVSSKTVFTCTNLKSGINYTGAKWVGRTQAWSIETKTITSSSSQTLTLDLSPYYNLGTGEGFYLNNKLEFLDSAGEWYYDYTTKTVYFWTPNGDSPVNYHVRGSTINELLTLNDKNYIVIKDLELPQSAYRGIYANNCSNLVLDNNRISYPDGEGITILKGTSKNNIVTNNELIGANHHGMKIYSSNSTFSDNQILNTALFENLGITGMGKSFIAGRSFDIIGDNNTISYNRIVGSGYIGIGFYGLNTLIQYNYIKDIGLALDDGGGIYTWDSDVNNPGVSGSIIRSNIILNVPGNNDGGTLDRSYGIGIFMDGKTHDVLIENNTVGFCSDVCIYLHNTRNIKVNNNLMIDGRYVFYMFGEFGGNVITNNIFYALAKDLENFTYEKLIGQRKAFGSYNNNTYINHYRSADVFRNQDSFTTFNGWKTQTGEDANSTLDISPLAVGEKEELFFNETKQTKTINLGSYAYRDISGKQITSTFTLEPFTSILLIKTTKIINVDTSDPTISSFIIPSTSSALTVPILDFTASDNIAVTGFKLTETSGVPNADDAGWSSTAPNSYIFSGEGTKTLYAWVKDAVGNISSNKSDQVNISLPVENNGYFVGNTEIYSLITTSTNRRAMPVTFNESGSINSISIFHDGGTGNMLLGVYSDQSGSPSSLIGITASANVNSNAGWQSISLTNPVSVTSGQTVWLAWVFQNNPGIRYTYGTTARAQSAETWPSGMPSSFGDSNLSNYEYSVYCTYSSHVETTIENLGNSEIYSLITTSANRRAIPVTFNKSGSINSISIYHNGGTGNMLMGVYSDQSGSPSSLIGITASTSVNSNIGWQSISLTNPVSVASGQTVWLAWVFQDNPGIRYTYGTPARAQSAETWPSGMPSSFRDSNFSNIKYSVFCTYSSNQETISEYLGNTETYSLITTSANRRAIPVIFNESGSINSISIYHNGGTGNMLMGVYSDQSGSPSSLMGVTASTSVNSIAGWQSISLTNPVSVTSGQTVWLAWVFQDNPGIRYTYGTPARAQSAETWPSGMPSSFGGSNFSNIKYSVYCTYSVYNSLLKDAKIQNNNFQPTIAFSTKNENEIKNNFILEDLNYDSFTNDFLLFPNPATNYINVKYTHLPETGTKIMLLDGSGRILVNQLVQTNITRIEINHLPAGMYFVKSTNFPDNVIKKIIVTR